MQLWWNAFVNSLIPEQPLSIRKLRHKHKKVSLNYTLCQLSSLHFQQISPFTALLPMINQMKMQLTSSAWLTRLTVPLPKRHEANTVSRCKWESPVQILKHPPEPPLIQQYTTLCVCVFVCVGRGSSNKSAGFVASTVAALFERGPGSVPSASCDRNSSSSLLSTQLVFARNLFSSAVWMCARLCTLNKRERCIFFPLFLEGEKLMTHNTRPSAFTLQWPDMCVETDVTGWGSLWRYSDNWQSTGGFEKCIEQLVCKDSGLSGGRGFVGNVMSLGMWEVAYIKGQTSTSWDGQGKVMITLHPRLALKLLQRSCRVCGYEY